MGNHFYGSAISEHYEKKIKDFVARDWVVVGIFIAIVIGVIASVVSRHWGFMIICLGLFASSMDVAVRVIFNSRSKVTSIFVVIGILAIIAGAIIEADLWNIFPYYICFCLILFAFGVGVICTMLKVNFVRKMKEYSITVEAECEMVDVKKINLFRFDDLPNMPYTASINKNTLYKPGFHYVINGQEYFTESTVYYGDLNRGFVEGNRVMLKVNPDNPHDILPINADSSFANMAMVMGIFWLVAGIIGIVVLILMINGVIRF